MRIARKLTLLALAAIAAMALGASAANATPVEVVSESSGQHCTFTSCSLHGISDGNVQLEGYFFGFHVVEASCMNEYTLQLDEMGGAQITAFRIFSGAGSDSNCDTLVTTSALPWKTSDSGGTEGTETANGVITAGLGQVSITNAETGNCAGTFVITITENAGEHYRGGVTNGRIGTSNCYIDGGWVLESDTVHANHL